METSPDIASIAALIGDPARSRILLALMAGRALTATELSLEADVSPSTTSVHLAKLRDGGLIRLHKQGRHRYFHIADELVAELIETLCGVASRHGKAGRTVITGPKDPAMRKARVCYDHLAGEMGVRLFDSLIQRKCLMLSDDGLALTELGEQFIGRLGIDVGALAAKRRATCRQCLDWSVRRYHLAGALGAELLTMIYQRRWAERDLTTRTVHFTTYGEAQLKQMFPLRLSQTRDSP